MPGMLVEPLVQTVLSFWTRKEIWGHVKGWEEADNLSRYRQILEIADRKLHRHKYKSQTMLGNVKRGRNGLFCMHSERQTDRHTGRQTVSSILFLRKLVQQRRTNMTSFCMHFKKDVDYCGKLSGGRENGLLA